MPGRELMDGHRQASDLCFRVDSDGLWLINDERLSRLIVLAASQDRRARAASLRTARR